MMYALSAVNPPFKPTRLTLLFPKQELTYEVPEPAVSRLNASSRRRSLVISGGGSLLSNRE